MASPSAVRSFAISLAIAIAIIGPQASGFAINRNSNISPTAKTLTTDLSSDESIRLQAKDDLKRPNEIGTNTDGDPSKTTNNSNINKTTTAITANISEMKTVTTPSVAQTTMDVRRTTEDTKIPTITSDTVEVFDSVELVTENKKTDQPTNISKESFVTENQLDLNQTNTSLLNTNTAANSENSSETYLSTDFSSATDQMATESERTNNHSMQRSSDFSYDDRKITTKLNHTSGMTSDSINKSTSTTAPLIVEISTTVSSNNFLSPISELSFSNISSSTETSASTKEFSKSSNSNLTESTTDVANTNIPEPLRKKYASIIRKSVRSQDDDTSSSRTTRTEDESMKAETSNTYVNTRFEQSITSIPYLDNISAELQRYTKQPSLSGEVVKADTVRTSVATESTIPSLNAIDNTDGISTETVYSKRAGYLDNSEKTIKPFNSYFTSIESKENSTVTYGSVKDIKATETEGPEVKKVSSSESQSQLAEDAIQEELMKEEALKTQDNNVKADYEGVKPLLDDDASSPANAADSLSVQPIHERTKTTLYTLSPNYKPMKKIDVQPSKQFVRDPDDNSWRNESISSLGIVFKPKNSSISFKEVLKNKTQTEFNNLQEKDNSKENVPDLRVRLEKIAEVRKTKKKKLNKDGVEIYTDYEESSSAESSTPKQKQEMIFSVFSSAELTKPTTSTPLESPKDTEVTQPMNVWKAIEEDAKAKIPTVDSLGVNPLTTDKPKKFFNIAEYYDTTDEYDADYVTMSKLDLKRFTVPRTTRPMPTRPAEVFPDRKPTVQYFPPRKPQKSNANLDDDFEKRMNALTFKDPTSKTEPRLFATVPPVHIATSPVATPAPRPGTSPAFTLYIPADFSGNYFSSSAPRPTESHAFRDGAPVRGSYVIKHYRDFLDAAAKGEDDDRNSNFTPLTELPRNYDYDAQFRKELLNHFVENFNQNSERFKADFPVLYNSSVVHRPGVAAASSRAFLRRLYGEGTATRSAPERRPCEPACDVTLELSPAYELHYYVPEQEEKETAATSEPEPEPRRYLRAQASPLPPSPSLAATSEPEPRRELRASLTPRAATHSPYPYTI